MPDGALEDGGGVDNESIAAESSEHNEGKTVVAVVGALFIVPYL